jgi:hypothetical protein
MWCWRGVEKIIWADRVSNEVLKKSKGGQEYPESNKKKRS